MKKTKRADLDLIRCFAIIFVISVHGLSYVGFYELSNPSMTLFVCHLIRAIVIICVPLFLILTGYLSAEKEYILNLKYLEKPFRLLAIYIICALICSIPQFMRGEIKSFFVALFEFKAAPYAWYLAMYLGLYLMIPFLNEFIASKNGGRKGLFVLIVLVTLPTVTNNCNFNSFEWWNGSKEQSSQLIPNYWDELYPIMYYMIGAFLKHNDAITNKLKNKKLLFVGTVFVFATINCFKNYNTPFSWDWATSYGGYQCLIVSVIFFCSLLGWNVKNQKIRWVINSVAKYSFGMYLISWPIDIVVYKMTKILLPQYNPILILPITITIVFVCAYICSIIVTKAADIIISKLGSFLYKFKNT